MLLLTVKINDIDPLSVVLDHQRHLLIYTDFTKPIITQSFLIFWDFSFLFLFCFLTSVSVSVCSLAASNLESALLQPTDRKPISYILLSSPITQSIVFNQGSQNPIHYNWYLIEIYYAALLKHLPH